MASQSATVGILRVLLSANSAEFETAMGRTTKSLGNVGKQGSAMSAVMTGVVAGGVAAVATAAINLAHTLGTTLVNSIGEVITRGGEVAGIAQSFERLSGGAGQAESALGTLREATRGLVSNFDLMQSSNKAILLGLGLSEQEMGDLAKTATVLGRAMGMDATKSLDDLITALGRSSPMILDNLGLTVKLGEANEAYAAKLGKTATDLTDAEKKQAFMTAAMEAARTKVAELGESQLTLTERLQQASTWYQNVFDRVSRGIVESPKLAAAFDGIARSLVIAFGGDSQNLVSAIIGLVEGLASSALTTAQAAIGAADGIVRAWYYVQGVFYGSMDAILSVESGLRGLAASAFEMAAKTPGIGSAFDGVASSMRAAANETTALRDQYRQSAADANTAATGQNAFSQTVQQVQFALTDAQAAMNAAKTATRETGTAAVHAKPPIDALGSSLTVTGERARGAAGDLKIITGELDNITRFQIAGILNPQLVDFQTKTNNAAVAMGYLRDQLARMLGQAQEVNNFLVNRFQPDFTAAFVGPVQESEPRIGQFFRNVFGSAGEFGAGVSSIFQAAFVGGGGALGAVKSFATQAMSNLLGMIPGVGPFVSAFAGPIIEMFGKLIGKAKEFFRTLFGGPSRAELNDRAIVASFEDTLIAGLTAAQKAEAGGERWKEVVIAIRDKYIELGLSEEEALRDAERLWASSKEGGEETWRVVDEITRKMQEQAKASAEAAKSTADAAAEASETAAEAAKDATEYAGREAEAWIRKVGSALADLPDVVDIDIRGNWRIPDLPREREGDPGFAGGTMGRFGEYFANFGSGLRTTLHGVEAVLRPQDALPFAMAALSAMPAAVGAPVVPGAPGQVVVMPILMESGQSPTDIGRAAAKYLAESGLAVNAHGVATAVERIVRDYRQTYG